MIQQVGIDINPKAFDDCNHCHGGHPFIRTVVNAGIVGSLDRIRKMYI